MKTNFLFFILTALLACVCTSAYAQNKITLQLEEEGSGNPVEYATVTLSKKGAKSAAYAALSTAEGAVTIPGVKNGTYILKAELLGYKTVEQDIKVEGDLSLGTLKMKQDVTMLGAATVSAVGNPIVIKKDTIEYNASSFKTADNDVLEDLLKKLPGVEVSEDGSITVNGETIKKITIDGKTFFLDDPQLASKNIPAKAIEKLKVIQKKSEQAEFSGIDDGEEEHVIDLSVKKGMMNGSFGNVMAGVGHDIPAASTGSGDWRFQGAGFLGNFTKNRQISIILNANNTNNRGFNDLSGSMMQNIRGGGGGMGRNQGGWGSGNGITTSYMGGINGAWTLFDNRMNVGGNYLYNNTRNFVTEESDKTAYLTDYNLLYNTSGKSDTRTYGHRFGARLEHKFSENTSIIFEPQFEFGGGSFYQKDTTDTYRDSRDWRVSSAGTNNLGSNKNFSTSGFLLFRQRLGIPGRTLTAMFRYSASNNDLLGENHNITTTYDEASDPSSTALNQWYTTGQKAYSLRGRLTYTEPLGNHFYIEADYSYNLNNSSSLKNTYTDAARSIIDYEYSNEIQNNSNGHEIGANAMYQKDKFQAQLGVVANVTNTVNTTTVFDEYTKQYTPKRYEDLGNWRWAPQAMIRAEFSENSNLRLFYRGRSSQPSTSLLMPVPDNTNPLNISFGNPSLKPYFTHTLRGNYRFNNKKSFFSLNVRLNGSYVDSPIVNIIWYGTNGVQYSMPFNGPASGRIGLNSFLNSPIARSEFSLSNMLNVNWSTSSSYVGKNIDMSKYDTEGYYKFMEWFSAQLADPDYFNSHMDLNKTQTLTAAERLRLTYRNDFIEVNLSGQTRINKSWYTIAKTNDNTLTFNNQIQLGVNWTWDAPGIGVKADFNYNWYNGYTTAAREPEYVLNAEISKLLFKKSCTIALKGYDILGQAKNLNVTDNSNYHIESVNNTLGRYIILSFTWRFGTFDSSKMMPRGGRMGGPPPMGR